MAKKMRAAHLKGYQNFEIVEVDIPTITPDQVLVKIDKVGICGSDIGMWNNRHFFNDCMTGKISLPVNMVMKAAGRS